MLQKNSRYLEVEDIIQYIDPKSLEVRPTLGIRQIQTYKRVDESKFHIVVPGDDLFYLALKYYDDASLWWVIADNNYDVIDDPFELKVNTELFIPKINF